MWGGTMNEYKRSDGWIDGVKEIRIDGHLIMRKYQAIVCKDGYEVSVQATDHMYCSPRIEFDGEYIAVELGFPNRPDELIDRFAEDPRELKTETVYPYVPSHIVLALIEKHGGIISGRTPLLASGGEEE